MKPSFLPSAGDCLIVASAIVIGFFVNGTARLSGLYFVAFLDRFDTGREQASIPFIVAYAIRNLASPITGYLGTTFGARPVVLAGCFLGALGIGLGFLAQDILFVIIAWGGIYGLGFGLASPLVPQILSEHFPRHFDKATGMFLCSVSIAGFILPMLGDWATKMYGVSGSFLVLSAAFLHTVPAALVLMAAKANLPSVSIQEHEHRDREGLSKTKHVEDSLHSPMSNTTERTESSSHSSMTNTAGDTQDSIELSNAKRIDLPSVFIKEHEHRQNHRVTSGHGRTENGDVSLQSSMSKKTEHIQDSFLSPLNRTTGLYEDSFRSYMAKGTERIENSFQSPNTGRIECIEDSLQSCMFGKKEHTEDTLNSSMSNIKEHIKDTIQLRDVSKSTEHIEDSFRQWKTAIEKSSLDDNQDVPFLENSNNSKKSCTFPETSETIFQNKKHGKTESIHTSESTYCERHKKAYHSFSLFLDPSYILMLLIQGLFSLATITIWTVIVDASIDNGVKEHEGLHILEGLNVLEFFGRILLGYITDTGYISKTNFSSLCFLALGIDLIVFPWLEGFVQVMVAVSFYGFMSGFLAVGGLGIVQKYVRKEDSSMGFSALYSVSGLFSFAQPLLIGYFRENLQSYDGLLYLLGAMCILSSILTLLIPIAARSRNKRISK